MRKLNKKSKAVTMGRKGPSKGKKAFNSALALGILSTGVLTSTNITHAQTTDTNAPLTSLEKALINIKVDNTSINKAVEDAKAKGVIVNKDADKNFSVVPTEITKTQEEIKADYDKQISEINKATSDYTTKKDAYDKAKADYDKQMDAYNTAKVQYDKDLKAYEDYMKNPDFSANKTEFSKTDLQKFLGDTPANVTYISGNQGKEPMVFDAGNLKEVPQKVLTSEPFNSNGNKGDYTPKDYAKPYYFEKGSTWSYKHALYDNKTGQDVDVKYTVTDLKMMSGGSLNSAIADVRTTNLGANMLSPIQEATIKIEYFSSKTGEPIKLDALNGMGDLDAGQYYQLKSPMDSVLKGSKVIQTGDQSWKAESLTAYDAEDPGTQVWTLAKGVSSQEFVWGTEPQPGDTDEHRDDYWANGNIEFGLKLKDKPIAPVAPKAPEAPKPPTVNYHLDTLQVTPTNHKDVESGAQKSDTKDSIDGKDVRSGDVLTYPLTNMPLPANRIDTMESYVLVDTLPEGVTFDESETKKVLDASKWSVTVEGQKVTYTASKTLLEEMNKDKTKEYVVGDVPLVVKVDTNTDKTIENTFDTLINNKDVHSNTVKNPAKKIPTKTELKKSVLTDDNKEVNERNVDIGKEYTYHVTGKVSDDDRLKTFEIKDDMEDVLTPKNVKIIDKDGKDIKDTGKLTIDEKGAVVSWKPNDVKSIIGKTLTMVIQSEIKPGTDLSKYLKDNKFVVPNTAQFIADGKAIDSNKVDVVTPKIKLALEKKIIDGDKLVDLKEVKKGEDVQYVLKYVIPNGEVINDLTLKDDLEDVTDLKDVKVYLGDIKSNTSIEAPKTDTTSTEDKTTEAPKTDATSTEDKTTEAPKTDATSTEDKTTEAPKTDATSTEDKTTEAPKTDATSTEDKTTEAPKTDATSTEDKTTEVPTTNATSVETPVSGSGGSSLLEGLKEITKDGELKMDQDKETFDWTVKDGSKYAGKTITVVVNGTLKKDADMNKYKEHMIPNIGELEYTTKDKDGKDKKESHKTNVVNITNKDVPKEQPKENPKTPSAETPSKPDVVPSPEQPKETPSNPVQKAIQNLPATGQAMLGNPWTYLIGAFVIIGGVLLRRKLKTDNPE